MRTTVAGLVALGLILAACSPDDESIETTTTELVQTTTTTSTSTTTTTVPPTTTTTTEPEPTSLVNGLPLEDPVTVERRVLAVKIDNHPRANPQSGIEKADMVIELRVEGITRYVSIWHESDAEYLGPMRSGRPTDPTLLAAFNEPTFAISGAQAWVQQMIVGRDVHLVSEEGPPATFRIAARRAPHNLYVNTLEIRAIADRRDYPDLPPDGPMWEFGPMSDYAEPVSTVDFDFGNTVTWTWDETLGLWLRNGYGRESTYLDDDGLEQPIGVPILVALIVEQYTAGPPPGVGGTSLPSSRTTGTGAAYVFADGRVTQGTWERQTEQEWFTLMGPDGEVMPVPPGKVWVSLVPDHGGVEVLE